MMRKIPSLLILFFAALAGCDNEDPSYPIEPEIEFESIFFSDAPDTARPDTLKLTFSYTDGDGDLGLPIEDIAFVESPYHSYDLYQTNGSQLVAVAPVHAIVNSSYRDLLEIQDPSLGKLVFPRTRNDPSFSSMLPLFSCVDYISQEFLLSHEDIGVIDSYSKIVDTTLIGANVHYLINDTLYLTRNPNHYNIEVDFLVEQSDGSFEEYDWLENHCATFDARFPPMLSGKSGPF
jgi:hypothetical protein